MYKEDYLAKQGRFQAACEEVGMCVEAEQAKGSLVAAEQQVRPDYCQLACTAYCVTCT